MSAQELGRKLTIGLVDNADDALSERAREIGRLGHFARTYNHPKLLLEGLAGEEMTTIDGLVVIANMRPIDGTMFARAAKVVHPRLPIVGLDLDPYHWTRKSRQESGIDAVIMLPFGPTAVRRVATFIDVYQSNPGQFPVTEPPHFLR